MNQARDFGCPPRAAFLRGAFTMLEVTGALALLAVVMIVVAQTGFSSMIHRQRNSARSTALELADNVLESARACPWKDLTPAWAERRKLSDKWRDHLPEGTLQVRVETEKNVSGVKRVTVTVGWRFEKTAPPQTVELTALFSARTASASGGTK